MNLKQFLLKLCCVLLAVSISQGCSTDKPGTWNNDEIKQGAREDFHALNDQVFKGLAANDPKELEGVMSKEYMDNSYKLRQIELISNRIKEGAYTLLDEYYVINAKRGEHIIKAKNKGTNGHTITYSAITPEMYLAFFVPKTGANKWMISVVYCKYDYGWKLNGLDLNPYTENGKTAPELYSLAKIYYNKHYLVDAVNTFAQAKDCLRPYEGWKYLIEPDMGTAYSKAIDEANARYTFPFILNEVKTRPRIFSINTETTPDGVFPVIYYQTKFKLKDTASISRENKEISKVIGKAIPGIDKNKKYIFFAAFNEWPRSDRNVDRVEMTSKLQ